MKKTYKVFILLIVMFLALPSGEARALDLDRVHVGVLNGDRTPVRDENVHLHLYRYDSVIRGQVNITDIDAGSCTTGDDGVCEIWLLPGMPKDSSGFYRGALEVRGMLRSILWPGGLFQVNLNLEELQVGENPDEEPGKGESMVIEHQEAVNWPWLFGMVVLIVLALVIIWWRRRKNRRDVLLALLLGLALAASLATPVRAAAPGDEPDYCSGGGGTGIDLSRCYSTSELIEYLMRWGITELGTGAAHSFDAAIWLLDRLCAGFFDLTVNSPILLDVKDGFLGAIAALMPNILRQMVIGPTGLFYIAVALSGILMTIPLWTENSKLVRPERAIAWGVVLAALFIGGGGMGYDLVNGIETLRSEIIQQVMNGTVNATSVVTAPMSAGSVSINSDTAWSLPNNFDAQYFPEAERQVVTVYIFEPGVPLFGGSTGNTKVETDESMQARQLAAGQSLIWALISIVGAVMLLLAALTFALLSVAAMLLILFLFAALPLGFFEFGTTILTTIIGKYLNVVMLSLAMAIFMRWVTDGLSFIGGLSDIVGAIQYLLILVIMIYALSIISGSAFRLLTESGQVFGQSMQAIFGAGPNVVGGIGGMLMGGALGGLVGGPAGALAGALGGAAQAGAESNSTASAVTTSLLSSVGFRAFADATLPVQNNTAQRGDVFRDEPHANGGEKAISQPQQRVERDRQGAQESRPQQNRQLPNQPNWLEPSPSPDQASPFERIPSTAEAEATLHTLAGREGWQDEQVQMIRSMAQKPMPEDQAVQHLAAVPGFERSTDEAIQQALRAAQTLGPAAQPDTWNKEEKAT